MKTGTNEQQPRCGIKVVLNRTGYLRVVKYLESSWGDDLLRKNAVRFSLVSSIESLIETRLRLGLPTCWHARGVDGRNHELYLEESEHFHVHGRTCSLFSLRNLINAYIEAHDWAWQDWRSADHIMATLEAEYIDENVPWSDATRILDLAIETDGEALDEALNYGRVAGA